MNQKQFNNCRWWRDATKGRTFDGICFWYSKNEVWGKNHTSLKTRILRKKKEILYTCASECLKIVEANLDNPDMHESIKEDYKNLSKESSIDTVTFRHGLDEFAVMIRIKAGYWIPLYVYDSKTMSLLYRVPN